MTDTMAPLVEEMEPMTPEELRSRRKRLGLNQTELAALFAPPVTQNTVSRWEKGRMAIEPPRSLWLDQEMRRIEREHKRPRGRPPKRRPTRRPREAPDA